MPSYPDFQPGFYKAGERCLYERRIWEKRKDGKATAVPSAGSVWLEIKTDLPAPTPPASLVWAAPPYRLNSVLTGYQTAADGTLYGMLDPYTHEPMIWGPAPTWFDGQPTTSERCHPGIVQEQMAGVFVGRALPYGIMNAGWFLVADGVTDNGPLLQKFNDWLAYNLREVQPFHVVIPRGRHFFATTPTFYVSNLRITWLEGAEFICPQQVVGLRCLGKGGHETYVLERPRITATSKDSRDGLVMSNDPEYNRLLDQAGITTDDKTLSGEPMRLPADATPQLVKSQIAEYGYQYHGIECTTRTTIISPVLRGFSGNGIVQNGLGHNVNNWEVIGGGDIWECGGAALSVMGMDGNAGTVSGGVLSCHDNGLNAVYDGSALGNYYAGIHASTNRGGNYLAVNPSNRAVFSGCYSEGDATKNRLLGWAQKIGGIWPNPLLKGRHALYIEGNEFGDVVATSMRAGNELVFGSGNTGAGEYFDLRATVREESPNQYVDFHFGDEAINQQVFGIFTAGGRQMDGTGRDVASVAMRTQYVGGLYQASSPVEPNKEYQEYFLARVYWKQGYYIANSRYNGENPVGWRCIQNGLYPGITYEAMEGLTVENIAPQLLRMSGISRFVLPGMVFTVNGVLGNDRAVLRTYVEGERTILEMSAPIDVEAGSTLVYPTALFKAQ